MERYPKQAMRWLLAGALLGLVPACGGGGGGGGTTPDGDENAATTESGEVVRTAGGEAVSVEAHNHWQSGLEAFEAAEEAGWTEARCEAVEESFEEAADAQGGTFPEAVYMRGLTLARCGEPGDARRYYERALEQDETLCDARVAVATMVWEGGDANTAFDSYYEATQKAEGCAPAYVNMARIQVERGGDDNIEEASRNLRRALAVRSDYMPAFNELALIYYHRGQNRRRRSSLDLAEIICRQAQLINGEYAPIFNTWGLIKMERGDLLEALRMFERARALDDSLFEAQMNFGSITNSFRGYEDAFAAYTRAVQLRPRSYDANLGLGTALRGLGRIDEALAQYQRTKALDEARPEAYYNIGLIHQDYRDGTTASFQEAKRWYNQFLERAGDREEYAEAVESITRTCTTTRRRRGRRRGSTGSCRPGRMQVMDQSIELERMMSEPVDDGGGDDADFGDE